MTTPQTQPQAAGEAAHIKRLQDLRDAFQVCHSIEYTRAAGQMEPVVDALNFAIDCSLQNARLLADKAALAGALETTQAELITLIPHLSGSFQKNMQALYEHNKAALAAHS